MKYRIRKITTKCGLVQFIPERRVFFIWTPFNEGAFVRSVVSRPTLKEAKDYLANLDEEKIFSEEYLS